MRTTIWPSFLAFVAVACSSGGNSSPLPAPTPIVRDADVSGRWHGGISTFEYEEVASVSLTLTQVGTVVEGMFECLYWCAQRTGTIAGTVSGSRLTWQIVFPDGSSCDGFDGTVSGDDILGRFACASGMVIGRWANGAWYAARERASPCVPELVSPAANAILDNGRTDKNEGIYWDFDWTDCPGASYHLVVMGPTAINPLIDDRGVNESAFRAIECGAYITGPNMYRWRWRVRAFVNGRASEWSREGIFNVEGANTDPPQPCE